MKSRPLGAGQTILASQDNDKRDDARSASFLLAHQQLGALALGTNPTNGQTVTFDINGTNIVATFVTAIGSTANNILIAASAAASVQNLLNWLRRPDLTTSTQVAASLANQALLSYVGWAWPGSSTTVVPFSLNKNVNGITGGLTSFNITTTVTSGSWTAQTMQLYVEDGTYYINGTRYLFTGGSTPTVTAPSSHPRIDVLTIDTSGTLAWTTGSENVSPSAPSYPSQKVAICELYNVVGETALYDQENQQSGQGYISNDVRSFINYTGGADSIDGAWFTDLAGIPSGAGVIPVANLPPNSFNAQSFTAAAAVTKGQALIMGNGVSGYLTYNNLTGASTTGLNNYYAGQTFVTSSTTNAIRAFSMKLNINSSATAPTFNIYATNGSHIPTGASLATGTLGTSDSNTTRVETYVFGTPLAVSPSTEYAIVLYDAGGGNYPILYYNGSGVSSSYYLTGSTLGGMTASGSASAYGQVFEIETTAGKVQASDTTQTPYSTDVNDLAYNFCGFAIADAAANASVSVNLGPIDADQSGLTPGAEYYLNGSGGAIGSTAGGVSVKIGLAMSSTQLLVKFENHP